MPELNSTTVRNHFELLAEDYDAWKKKNAYYFNTIQAFVKKIIPAGSRVLDIGCATGTMLASLEPSYGVGIDISPKMIQRARTKFPQYTFIASSLETFQCDETFDYIVMVDLLDHCEDIISIFESVHKFCHRRTKVIVTTINPWWEPFLSLMGKIGAKMPEGPHNFIERRNLGKIIELLDFTIGYTGYLLLLPKFIPALSFLINAIGVKLWGINKFSLVHYLVMTAVPRNDTDLGLGCSVIVPCYNEEGNIAEAVRRIPRMGKETEVIVVNDGSSDQTADIVRSLQANNPHLKLIDYHPNQGKGAAVTKGFEAAFQEVVMILDADMSVPPEELPRFFDLLNKGKCDFVNGTRMVYPMQREAMRFLNLLGNKLFGLIMTFIVGQYLSDTLCGTKALYKKDYQRIPMGLDRWGDFDLLFGAGHIGSKIMEIPVHYATRKSGESKMKTFRHGLHLLKACIRGFWELTLFAHPSRRRDKSSSAAAIN